MLDEEGLNQDSTLRPYCYHTLAELLLRKGHDSHDNNAEIRDGNFSVYVSKVGVYSTFPPCSVPEGF